MYVEEKVTEDKAERREVEGGRETQKKATDSENVLLTYRPAVERDDVEAVHSEEALRSWAVFW
jgi:hypothetical protein